MSVTLCLTGWHYDTMKGNFSFCFREMIMIQTRTSRPMFLRDFYSDYKVSARIYLVLAVLVSVFFMYSLLPKGLVFADSSVRTISVNENEDWDLGRYGGPGGSVLQSASDTLNISIDPAIAVGVCAVGSILHEHGIWPKGIPDISFSLLDHNWARILAFIWCLFSISAGIIGGTLKDFNSKYVGPFMLLAFEVGHLLATYSAGMTVLAAEPVVAGCAASGSIISLSAGHTAVASFGSALVLAILEFLKLIAIYAIYLVVRVFIFGLDVILSLFSKLNPLIGIVSTSVKASLLTLLTSLSKGHPILFTLLGVCLVALSGVLFRWAYYRIRYFKQIYLLPFLHSIFRKGQVLPSIHPKVPKWLRVQYASEQVLYQIPVFSRMSNRGFRNYELWWMTITPKGMFVDKSSILSREKQHISFSENGYFNPIYLGPYPQSSKELFIRGPHKVFGAYCEIYSLMDAGKHATSSNKASSLVFNREYANQLPYIAGALGFRTI